MLDFDPRDYDSRDEERHANTPSRGSRGSSGDHDRDHDWRQPDTRPRDRDDGDARSLGRRDAVGREAVHEDEGMPDGQAELGDPPQRRVHPARGGPGEPRAVGDEGVGGRGDEARKAQARPPVPRQGVRRVQRHRLLPIHLRNVLAVHLRQQQRMPDQLQQQQPVRVRRELHQQSMRHPGRQRRTVPERGRLCLGLLRGRRVLQLRLRRSLRVVQQRERHLHSDRRGNGSRKRVRRRRNVRRYLRRRERMRLPVVIDELRARSRRPVADAESRLEHRQDPVADHDRMVQNGWSLYFEATLTKPDGRSCRPTAGTPTPSRCRA